MALKIYNTLTREKEIFKPLDPQGMKVGIYLCGPTVYKPSHIGHAVGPVIFDALKRYLTFLGYKVTFVVNVTDVDDKLIVEAAHQGCTVAELARRVLNDYVDSMAQLGIQTGSGGIDVMPKATEHIAGMIDCIQNLIDKGAAYPLDGDVYFSVSADDDYGKLSGRRSEDQEGQRDLKSGAKRNPGDFALWKAAKPEEPRDVKFDSPWGPGRPGWHIECSVMSARFLGETFDIHGGGLDLVFPHHENEIAQSETATGKPFARVWMHHGLTRFNTKKVSKSDPTMVEAMKKMTLSNLLKQHSGELLRFMLLATHYRSPIDFADEEVESKKKAINTFYRLFERVERITGQSPYEDVAPPPSPHGRVAGGEGRSQRGADFLAALEDDFNTGLAIATLFEFAGDINRTIEASKVETSGDAAQKSGIVSATRELIGLARILGLFQNPVEQPSGGNHELVGHLMQVLIDIRKHARGNKDFKTADLIRNRLTELGITLEDRSDGTGWNLGSNVQ